MPPPPLLPALRESRLFDAARWAELEAWVAARRPSARALADELLRRGWLTPFQLHELAAGRASALTLGPYQLLELIGEGGMGRVYKAVQPRLGRHVALKVIRSDRLNRPSVRERFRREIEAAAQLRHPNVVLAIDADEVDGVHFYAMEFVEGTDLTRMVGAHGPVPWKLACEYVRQAAFGLQHAAEQNLVHRDVKPSNLLLTPKGQVKVLDLGLAMLRHDPAAGGEAPSQLTQDHTVVGTPDFLAPEQAQNPGGVDCRADVYSLGATLFYLITAAPPFAGGTPREKILRHVTEPPPSARVLRPELPPALDALIQGMMAKRPEHRPLSPGHAASLLAPFAPAAAIRPPDPPPPAVEALIAPSRRYSARKPYRRPAGDSAGWAKPLVLTVLLLAGAGLAVALGSLFLPEAEAPMGKRFENSLGMTMIRLAGGDFDMGSPDDESGRSADEGPVHRVTVAGPIYMAATEVTHGQYLRLIGKSPAVTARKARQPEKCPVDNVSWAEAVEFCRRLTGRETDQRRGTYRLPDETEWEYACRAGTATAFSTGERIRAVTEGAFVLAENDPLGELAEGVPEREQRAATVTRPVGSTKPNPWGLFDLHGNVWEWCRDRYGPYPTPAGDDGGFGPRVVRGGAFDCVAARCRSAARRGLAPEFAEPRPDVGFRVVYDPTTRP